MELRSRFAIGLVLLMMLAPTAGGTMESEPMDAKAYYNRGNAYFALKDYNKAWDDVYKAQGLGFQINPGFLKALREASGRER